MLQRLLDVILMTMFGVDIGCCTAHLLLFTRSADSYCIVYITVIANPIDPILTPNCTRIVPNCIDDKWLGKSSLRSVSVLWIDEASHDIP